MYINPIELKQPHSVKNQQGVLPLQICFEMKQGLSTENTFFGRVKNRIPDYINFETAWVIARNILSTTLANDISQGCIFYNNQLPA